MVKKAAQTRPNHLLRQARQERAGSQRVVADRIGAPQDTMITRWERGNAIPSPYQNRDPNAPVFPPEGARQPGDEGSPAGRVALTGVVCSTLD